MVSRQVRTSKYLSLVLRHRPDSIGLDVDPQGWVATDQLIANAKIPLTLDLIREVVETSDKQRFALSDDGRMIRANQGHSIDVDLGLDPIVPPELLYHGTADRFIDSIADSGLLRRNRQYVHLSGDTDTATKVGSRHGRPVVLTVSARSMHDRGYQFFQSKNGVWLTESVPPEFLSFPTDDR